MNNKAVGPQNPNWKGGAVKDGEYAAVWIPKDHLFASMRGTKGYVRHHRLIFAEHIGRPLKRTEIVHHIDGDPNNNSIENLELFLWCGDHTREHMNAEQRAKMVNGLRKWGATEMLCACGRIFKAPGFGAHRKSCEAYALAHNLERSLR